MVRYSEVGGSALTIYMLSGSRASSVFIKWSANRSFHTTHSSSRYLLNRRKCAHTTTCTQVFIPALIHNCQKWKLSNVHQLNGKIKCGVFTTFVYNDECADMCYKIDEL